MPSSHHNSERSESWLASDPAFGTDPASPYNAIPPPSNEVHFAGTHRSVPIPEEPVWDEGVFQDAQFAAERQGLFIGQEDALYAPMVYDAGNAADDATHGFKPFLECGYDESYAEDQSQRQTPSSEVTMPATNPSGSAILGDTKHEQVGLQAIANATADGPSTLESRRRVSKKSYSCEESECIGKRWNSFPTKSELG